MGFGQVVIGPPGSGKTTYCHGMYQFLQAIERKPLIVNLDPANETTPYECEINLMELIELSEVMENEHLGPNGALMYCMEYLLANIDWLLAKLAAFKGRYFLFDCPGQIELYTHHDCMHQIVQQLQKENYRLTAVNLVDSFYCSQPTTFISVLLTSMSTMVKLELPHVNVLSKIDLMQSMGKLDFNLEFYTDVLDLSYLVDKLSEDRYTSKYKALNEAICGLVEQYSLVNFHTLAIEDKETVYALIRTIDKSNGYIFGGLTPGNEAIFQLTERIPFQNERVGDVQEKYLS